jgi:hypothetical protein
MIASTCIEGIAFIPVSPSYTSDTEFMVCAETEPGVVEEESLLFESSACLGFRV